VLKQVALEFSRPESQVTLTSCPEYLEQFPPRLLGVAEDRGRGEQQQRLLMKIRHGHEHIYPAELAVQQWPTAACARIR